MAWAQKWDFAGRIYRPYEIPDAWRCPLYLDDMDALIHCASCGETLAFGNSYTSRCIHNAYGFGYMVCAACMRKEIAAEKAVYKEKKQ